MAIRVLVVNDTQDLLDMFRLLLEDEGYEVCLSSFPLVKASEVEPFHPDIIILDLIFGDEKTGWQMLQMLKMQPSTARIPVVVCTAAIDATREMEGYLVAKNIQVVYKPFDIDELLRALTSALHSRTVTDVKGDYPET
ncbi:MAG: response regulator [Ktedonobacteraceae bacterium]|nr:response regulator [Ktedonobacteraceae bacterium]